MSPIRTLSRLALATALAATLALGTSAAGAGFVPGCTGNASTAPDGKLKIVGGSFVGNSAFPSSSVNASPVPEGAAATFVLKWKNTSATTRTIRVHRGLQSVSPGTSTKLFVDGVNVTQTLQQGLVFPGIAPGARTPTLQVVIKNKAGGEDFALIALHGRYGGSPLEACDALTASINAT
jgi:hypothetical protein